MNPLKILLSIVFLLSFASITNALSIDEKLDLVIKVHQLELKQCSPNQTSNIFEIKAGKALFESKLLSGEKNISCSDCHLKKFGSGDGLPMAVGTGAKGSGYHRLNHGGALVQRNALSLEGRANPEFKSLFWDGKIQVENGQIIAPYGKERSARFSNALAAASVLPIMERDELLGAKDFFSTNDIQRAVEDSVHHERFDLVSNAIRDRLNKSNSNADPSLKNALVNANINLKDIDLSTIGNLLSVFIQSEFPCELSRWDQYISGNKEALTNNEKNGAVIFYGKGRCASCHQGTFLSDFSFHSIGTPQGKFGPHSRTRDIGRAAVTSNGSDLFKFRTPPLNNVSKTSPYGHNGVFKTLTEVVIHHYDPVSFYLRNPAIYEGDSFRTGKLINSRDTLLSGINLRSSQELDDLISFLKTL